MFSSQFLPRKPVKEYQKKNVLKNSIIIDQQIDTNKLQKQWRTRLTWVPNIHDQIFRVKNFTICTILGGMLVVFMATPTDQLTHQTHYPTITKKIGMA